MRKLSIVVPVYNMANKLEISITSLLNQTYKNIEIILVDDGSKDNSYEICKKLAERNDNIFVYHTINQGAGNARNYGIDKATGEYIYFMDADDAIDDNAFSIVIERMENTNSDMAVFGYNYILPSGKVKNVEKWKDFVEEGNIVRKNYEKYFLCKYALGVPWNKLFKLNNIKKYNIKYPDLKRHQDDIFVARYVSTVSKICFIKDILYSYYPDDVVHMWRKCPDNYIDISNQLLKYRMNIIIKWNPSNENVKKEILMFYLDNIIVCIDLLFNPEKSRSWKDVISELEDIRGKVYDDALRMISRKKLLTHKIVLYLFKIKKYHILICFMKFKIIIKQLINKTYG